MKLKLKIKKQNNFYVLQARYFFIWISLYSHRNKSKVFLKAKKLLLTDNVDDCILIDKNMINERN